MLERILLGDDILIDFIEKCVYISDEPSRIQPQKQEWILINGLIERNHAIYTNFEIAHDIWGDIDRQCASTRYDSIKNKVSRLNNRVFSYPIIDRAGEGYQISTGISIKSIGKQQTEPIADAAHEGKIVSFVAPPVSKENYVARPDLERDISQSLHTNKITVIRGMSGLGKSELARKVATDDSDFSTIIRLELTNGGSEDFERALEKSHVTVMDIPDNITRLQFIKNYLEKAREDTLVMVDNYDDTDNLSFLRSLNTFTGNAKILITSQIKKNKLDEFSSLNDISAATIDLESNECQQEDFAQTVFCSYAGLTCSELTNTEQSAIQSICGHVAGHTMLVAMLGLRTRRYGEHAKKSLTAMANDVEYCLSSVRVKLQKDFEVSDSLTAYEKLKELSSSLLQRKYTEYERQVLGAIILLPSWSHFSSWQQNTNNLATFIGDSVEKGLFKASDAIERLHDDGILSICDDGRIILHPLFQKLVADSEISFYDNCGTCRPGPIAELTVGFKQHLMKNTSVSMVRDEKYDVFEETQSLLQSLLFSNDELVFENVSDQGWISFCYGKWFDEYPVEQIELIRACINKNHEQIGDGRTMSETEANLIFFSHIGAGLLYPQHPSAFFVIEHEKGRSLWIYDTVDKKEWCVVNLQNQRSKDNRYFKLNKTYSYTNSDSKQASLVRFLMDHSPEVLIVPCEINNTPVTTIASSLGHGTDRIKLLCLSPTVTHISARAFRHAQQLCHVIILGTSCVIEPLAFSPCCENLEYILLAKDHNYIGLGAFESCERLSNVFLPETTIMDTLFISKEPLDVQLRADVCLHTDVINQDGAEHDWLPAGQLLKRYPQLQCDATAYFPFPKDCKIHCPTVSNSKDALKGKIISVFSHVKWCLGNASALEEKGDYFLAAEYLCVISNLLAARSEFFGPKNCSSIMMSLGIGFAKCRMYSLAYKHLSQVDVTNLKDKASWLFYYGFVLGKTGKHKEALSYKLESLKQSTKIAKEATAETTHRAQLDLASDYNSIAESFIALKEYKQAYECLQKCLEIRKALLSPDDLSFALLYENYGDLYLETSTRECLECGQSCYKRATTIFSARFGPNHQNTVRVKQKLLSLTAKLEQITE